MTGFEALLDTFTQQRTASLQKVHLRQGAYSLKKTWDEPQLEIGSSSNWQTHDQNNQDRVRMTLDTPGFAMHDSTVHSQLTWQDDVPDLALRQIPRLLY